MEDDKALSRIGSHRSQSAKSQREFHKVLRRQGVSAEHSVSWSWAECPDREGIEGPNACQGLNELQKEIKEHEMCTTPHSSAGRHLQFSGESFRPIGAVVRGFIPRCTRCVNGGRICANEHPAGAPHELRLVGLGAKPVPVHITPANVGRLFAQRMTKRRDSTSSTSSFGSTSGMGNSGSSPQTPGWRMCETSVSTLSFVG